MTRHSSTRDFFRNTPSALLARYFKARGVLQDFDFAGIKETRIDALFEAWLALPNTQRARMDTELREVRKTSSTSPTERPPALNSATRASPDLASGFPVFSTPLAS